MGDIECLWATKYAATHTGRITAMAHILTLTAIVALALAVVAYGAAVALAAHRAAVREAQHGTWLVRLGLAEATQRAHEAARIDAYHAAMMRRPVPPASYYAVRPVPAMAGHRYTSITDTAVSVMPRDWHVGMCERLIMVCGCAALVLPWLTVVG